MAGALLAIPYLELSNADGTPLLGGLLYAYAAGTSTPQPLYEDYLLATEADNPYELDSAGRATLYMDTALAYKLVVKTSAGVTIRTTDQVRIAAPATGAAADEDDRMLILNW